MSNKAATTRQSDTSFYFFLVTCLLLLAFVEAQDEATLGFDAAPRRRFVPAMVC